MSREIVLYRAHRETPVTRAELDRLRAELPDRDVRVVGFLRDPPLDTVFYRDMHAVTAANIAALPYGAKSATFRPERTTGHNDLPVLHFFRQNPDYDQYWVVEYDVRWTGRWGALLDELAASPADLLATNVMTRAQDPGWSWWGTLAAGNAAFPEQHQMRAFLPFCRVSRAAMHAIDAAYAGGVFGHYEGVWPSVCALIGLAVEEIGGQGAFTPAARRGRFYSSTPRDVSLFPGSFVFRPSFRHDEVARFDLGGQPTLWHPVKE